MTADVTKCADYDLTNWYWKIKHKSSLWPRLVQFVTMLHDESNEPFAVLLKKQAVSLGLFSAAQSKIVTHNLTDTELSVICLVLLGLVLQWLILFLCLVAIIRLTPTPPNMTGKHRKNPTEAFPELTSQWLQVKRLQFHIWWWSWPLLWSGHGHGRLEILLRACISNVWLHDILTKSQWCLTSQNMDQKVSLSNISTHFLCISPVSPKHLHTLCLSLQWPPKYLNTCSESPQCFPNISTHLVRLSPESPKHLHTYVSPKHLYTPCMSLSSVPQISPHTMCLPNITSRM